MSSRRKRRAVVRLSDCKWRSGGTGITVPNQLSRYDRWRRYDPLRNDMLNLGHEPGMAGQALRCQRTSEDMRMRSVACWILGSARVGRLDARGAYDVF